MLMKSPIKISKSFGMKISAEYQSYDFGSSMEVTISDKDLSQESDRKLIAEWGNWLNGATIDNTLADIKAFAGANDTFRAILSSRNKKIESLPSELKISKTSEVNI